MELLSKLRNRLQIRHQLERLWPKFVPLEGGVGVYADRGIRLAVLANPHVYRRLIRLLARLLDKDATLIDCGANFGWITLSVGARLKQAGGNGRVLAIEANPAIATVLSKSIRRNRLENQISVVQTFVSDAQGETEFYSCTASETSSAYFHDHIRAAVEENSQQIRSHKVLCSTLDSLCDAHGLKNVGAVKVDVEGAELLALKGCKKLMQQQPTPVFIVEMNPVTARAAGYSIKDIWDFFVSHDFSIFEFAAAGEDYRLIQVTSFDEARLWKAGDIVAVKHPSLLFDKIGPDLSWD
jgi:FkbM family methyltransferase